MKNLLFVMFAMLFANQGWTQNVQIIVGNGNSTQNSCNIPGYYGWHNSAMLFTSTELQSLRGNIQNLAFQVATPNAISTNRSMKIWLKLVSKTTTALSTSSHMNDFLADATLVYDSNDVAVTATGWRTFLFSAPFAISGDSNLLVIVSGHACGTNGGCEVSQYYTTATNKAWLRRTNGASNIDFDTETGQPEYANNRFNTRFTITPDPAQCFSVLNLNVSSQTSYTAALQWTTQAGNMASEWEVQYKLNTVSSWNDPIVVTEPANTIPYTLQNLLNEQTYNVRVRTLCNPGGTTEGTDFSAWSPEFTFTQPSSCPPPAALTVPTVTASSATAIWIDETLAQEYVIQWKKASVSWDDVSVLSDAVLTGEESFTLTQLQSGTIYNVRMRTVCDYNVDSSGWVSATFTTQCGTTSVNVQNWTEGFEELAAANTLPPCWSATNFGNSGKVRTQITDYNSTQSFRYAHTGHSALYFTSSCDDNVKTPSFALTADSTYRFSFWYHTDGLDGWLNLSASVFDENDAFIGTVGTPLGNITNTDYRKYQGTFTPAASGTYYFSIKCQSNHSVWYLTIDDILLGIAPACPDVEYFTAIMHSPTSAALNWDLTASTGNGWLIAYSNETPFDPETADHIPVASTNNFPYIINGLEDGTTYNFAVQADCGGAWTDPVAITFPSLNSIKTVPYQQNFENTNDVAEWFFSNGADNNGWYIGSATSNPAGGNALYVSNNNGLFNNYTPHSGSGYGYVAASAIVNFGNYQSYTLSFDWYCPGSGTYVEYVCLKVFAVPMNYNLTNAWPSGENVHQIGGTFWHQLDWQHFYAVLPADIYANQQYKIVFMFSYDDGNAANPAPAIDNLAISGSNCSIITNITASAITTNSASITFSDSDP
ncbi:MAG: fibronectin type III domain-containing protein, partial [Bacteroidales bacterium]|nr:fibronectin type III domain-containing protein [Bacteroidales bacterium]